MLEEKKITNLLQIIQENFSIMSEECQYGETEINNNILPLFIGLD